MRRVHRPHPHITPDDIVALFLSLDERVAIRLANALKIIDVEEQFRVALIRHLVVDDGRARMMPVAVDNQASAALAGLEVSGERLTPIPFGPCQCFSR